MSTETTFPGKRIVGTCSLCAGPVTMPVAHYEFYQAAPRLVHLMATDKTRCENCGAVAVGPHGPVVAMYLKYTAAAVMD